MKCLVGYNFTDDAPPQPFLPIVAYWDDYDKVPYAFPHVYDYMEGADAVSREYPQLVGTYNRRRYLTAYGKEQKTEFGTIYIDHKKIIILPPANNLSIYSNYTP
ncbi:hypothetical protein [Paenibacillus sp. DYY-L-2]|uniref:hypothetical protein n=1 Tax=Paenibacillus sp. DYY-L-2 TaxID=3447013 RepID=UPI003F4F5E44